MLTTLLSLAFADPGLSHQIEIDRANQLMADGHAGAALEHFRTASRHADGKVDPAVWLGMADACVAMAYRGCAEDAAEQALTWSRNDEQAERARGLTQWLDSGFGALTIKGPASGVTARVDLQPVEPVDGDKGAWLDVISARLADGVVLPMTVAVPTGVAYTVDGLHAQVEPGENLSVSVAVQRATMQNAELQLSMGFRTSVDGSSVPSPGFEAGVLVPARPIVLGARFGFWESPSAAVELGLGGNPDRAFRFRPGVSFRVSVLDELMLSPGVWASIAGFERNGSRGFSTGVRAVIEPGFGLEYGVNWTARMVIDLGWDPS